VEAELRQKRGQAELADFIRRIEFVEVVASIFSGKPGEDERGAARKARAAPRCSCRDARAAAIQTHARPAVTSIARPSSPPGADGRGV
jgi:hypothetical protein